MPDYLTTGEVAALLRLKTRKVYDLANSGALPCSRATGKLLFPADAVNRFIAGGGGAMAPVPRTRPNVVLGSHDPLLDWALRESRCGLATFFDGSDDGLDRFAADEGIATGLHLFDAASGTWNVAAVTARFSNDNIVLIEWAKRQRGLIVADHVTQKPRTVADLRGLTIATRQTEAGAQTLLLSLLAQAGLTPGDVTFTEPARTEADAVQIVSEGRADATLGLSALAKVHKLAFVPILTERFDLMVDRKAWFDPPMQAFLTFCRSDRFRARALDWHGYDVSGLGQITFNA